MSGLRARLARLEAAARASQPARVIVVWPPGHSSHDPGAERRAAAAGPGDWVIRVVYVDRGPLREEHGR